MQRDLWTLPIEWRGNPLEGFDVEALDGLIGSVDKATYDVGGSYLVVQTGSWIAPSTVLLPGGLVEHIDSDARRVHLNRTSHEIENAPQHRESVFVPAYRGELASYYGVSVAAPFQYTFLTTSGRVLGRYEADAPLAPGEVVELRLADRRYRIFSVLGAIATVTSVDSESGTPLRSVRDRSEGAA